MRVRRTAVLGAALACTVAAAGVSFTLSAHAGTAPTVVAVAAAPKLDAPPTITANAVQVHLNKLMDIAKASNNTRTTGTVGYTNTVNYIKQQLDGLGWQTTVQDFTANGKFSSNVIAEWPAGDANQVVMFGAHADSVAAGPGLNDNGSGVSALLENAAAIAQAKLQPTKRIRFAFWGAEELGLLGSNHYVSKVGAAETKKITAYYNFDMIGNKSEGGKPVSWTVYSEGASNGLNAPLQAYFKTQNVTAGTINVNDRSDHAAFKKAGVKVTGATSVKNLNELGSCYHRSCDDLTGVDKNSVALGANAIAYTVWSQAGGTSR